MVRSGIRQCMNEQELDDYVRELRDAPLPDCPPDLEMKVLRRVHLTRSAAMASPVEWLAGAVWRTPILGAAAAIVIGVSAMVTVSAATPLKASRTGRMDSSRALGFDVLHYQDLFSKIER